jgi:hypothetical protein
VLHTGALPPQSVFPRHPTQIPVVVRQSGVEPPHAPTFAAEHWPHAPDGSQAGVVPPHSPSPEHPRHVWVVVLHTGAEPPQSPFETQATQVPEAGLQTDVAPPHFEAFVAEH